MENDELMPMKRKEYLFLFLVVTLFAILCLFLIAKSVEYGSNSPLLAATDPSYVIILGDTGNGSQAQYDVAYRIKKHCQQYDCYSAFIAGDIIYNNGVNTLSDTQFNSKFEQPYAQVDLVFNIAYGNHDYHGCTKCYMDYSNISPKWNMPFKYYKISYPEVDYFVINTESVTERQQDWLRSGLETSKARWKVVIGHKPLITYEETHTGEKWEGRQEIKSIICHDADVYVSGHSHLLEDIGKVTSCTVKQLISGGGGAALRDIVPNTKDKFFYEGHGFLTMGVVNSNLTYGFRDVDGKLLRKVVLTK